MADINGRPFIERQIEFLGAKGFRRFVLCSGYGQDYLVDRFVRYGRSNTVLARTAICVVTEDHQLGTAAAIIGAIPEIHSDPFLIVNGDTVCEMDYGAMIRSHFLGVVGKRTAAEVSITIHRNTREAAGVWLVSRKLFPYLYIRVGVGLDVCVAEMAKTHPSLTFSVSGFYDIGTPDGLEALRDHW